MKRLWLVFAQAVTVLLAAWFVVATLKPQWLGNPRAVPGSTGTFTICRAKTSAAVAAWGAI